MEGDGSSVQPQCVVVRNAVYSRGFVWVGQRETNIAVWMGGLACEADEEYVNGEGVGTVLVRTVTVEVLGADGAVLVFDVVLVELAGGVEPSFS